MANSTIATSVGASLAEDIEDAAESCGVTTSQWLKEAARQKLQRETDLSEAESQ